MEAKRSPWALSYHVFFSLPVIKHYPSVSNFPDFGSLFGDRLIMQSRKDTFLKQIKPNLSYWPWTSHASRLVETALAKLRVGHANVAERLYRIQKADSPQCNCGANETIGHFLLRCPIYNAQRSVIITTFSSIDQPLTLSSLLGGGSSEPSEQSLIQSALVEFLVAIVADLLYCSQWVCCFCNTNN